MSKGLVLVSGLLAAVGIAAAAACGGGGTSAPTPDPTPTASPAATPAPLPEPDAGYKWYVTPPNDYGLPPYAVQLPERWSMPLGPFYVNPVSFKPEDATNPPGPALVIQVAEARFLTETPHLFYWLLPHHGADCQEIVRTAQQIRPAYAWDTFSYTCTTRDPDNPDAYVILTGFAAEVRVGEFVFSIAARQPPDSTASEAAFLKATDSFTLQ